MAAEGGAVVLDRGPRSAGFVVGRCNPYGHESGGPKHLLGGMYGPQFEGETKWFCENPATVRARMMCQYGHKGQEMKLCQPHAIEIQRRQSGLCPPCAWPAEALQWHEVIETLQNELQFLNLIGRWDTGEARLKRAGVEAAATRMTELYQNGTIKNSPLVLTEVS